LALSKTGLIDDSSATKIGHMLGAQVMVTGKAFPLDDELFIVAKVIGVETSRVYAAKTSGALSGKLAPMVESLSKKVSKILLKHDTALVGKEKKKTDYVVQINKSLGSTKRPHVSVFVSESHLNREVKDPAVETELIYLLTKSNFKVTDERNRPLSDWAKAYLDDSNLTPPKDADADVLVVGEAFSEFATRRGELISCKARVELRAIDVKSGRIIAIERKTATVVDIAENIAAKAALQKATQELSLTFIPDLAKKWNKK